jgi:DNA-binding XRE family transcriptional regulator
MQGENGINTNFSRNEEIMYGIIVYGWNMPHGAIKEHGMTIGDRLKRLRELAGLSQGELARKAGVNRPIISSLESNKRHNLTLETARRLARALGVTLDMLAGDDREERYEPGRPGHSWRLDPGRQ